MSVKIGIRTLVYLCWLAGSPVAAQYSQADSHEERYRRGSVLARSGQLEAALQELEKAAQLAPQSPKVHNLLGVVLTQLGRLTEAEEAYRHAISLAPDFVPARKNRAVNLFTLGRLQLATAEFEAVARLEPRDFVPHLFLGLLSIEEADFPAARQHLLQAHQLSPGQSKVLLALTRVHFTLGERASALASARQLQSQSRSSDAERFELGGILAQFGSYTEAVAVFQELWQKRPGLPDLGFNLALVQYHDGQLQPALHTLKQLQSHTQPTGELLSLQGWIYNKMRNMAAARESLQHAIDVESDNPNHYLDLSMVLKNSGDVDGAMRVILAGIDRNIPRDRLLVQLGLLHQDLGHYEEAETCYRDALHTASENGSAYIALAHLLSSTQREAEALAWLEKGIRLLPRDALLHYVYGALLMEADSDTRPAQLGKAQMLLEKARDLNPLYSNTHYLLGKLYLKQGNSDAAQVSFEKACAFNPRHAGAYYQRSLLARRRGKREEAEELGRIVQRINMKADETFRESFSGMVQETLRGAPLPRMPSRGSSSPR